MSAKIELMCCCVLVIAMVAVSEARPPQGFETPAQAAAEIETPERNMIDRGDALDSFRLQLLAQQLNDYNAFNQFPGLPDRIMMTKRQQRYRQCYFNPISCFRK